MKNAQVIPRTNSRYQRRLALTGFLFTLPVIIFFGTFSLYPVGSAFVVSFFKYNLFSPMKWAGFFNYGYLLQNSDFWSAIRVTVGFMLYYGPISWVVGFSLAMMVKEAILARGFFRSVYFIPSILSAVAMATAWSLLLRKNGPINVVLHLQTPWLTNQLTALWGIAIMQIWQRAGWFMVIFLAGLQGVPETYYEAARIDGAGAWKMLYYITLPLLRPVFALVFIWTIIDGVKVFTPMYLMTGGGPNNATRSLAMLIYQSGIQDYRMGQASAVSVLSFLLVLILTVIQLRFFRVGRGTDE